MGISYIPICHISEPQTPAIPSSVVLYSWLLLLPGSRSCYCTSRLVSCASDDPPSAFFSCSSNSSHNNTARSTTCSAPQPVFPTRFLSACLLGHPSAPVYNPHSSAPVNSLHTVLACHSGSFGPAIIAPTVVMQRPGRCSSSSMELLLRSCLLCIGSRDLLQRL